MRLVLAALGQATMVSGSSVVEFGTRNIALHCALSHRTVARVLELLRNEPDPLIDVVSRRQLAERGPGGWRRGAVALDDVAESTGAADLQIPCHQALKVTG